MSVKEEEEGCEQKSGWQEKFKLCGGCGVASNRTASMPSEAVALGESAKLRKKQVSKIGRRKKQ